MKELSMKSRNKICFFIIYIKVIALFTSCNTDVVPGSGMRLNFDKKNNLQVDMGPDGCKDIDDEINDLINEFEGIPENDKPRLKIITLNFGNRFDSIKDEISYNNGNLHFYKALKEFKNLQEVKVEGTSNNSVLEKVINQQLKNPGFISDDVATKIYDDTFAEHYVKYININIESLWKKLSCQTINKNENISAVMKKILVNIWNAIDKDSGLITDQIFNNNELRINFKNKILKHYGLSLNENTSTYSKGELLSIHDIHKAFHAVASYNHYYRHTSLESDSFLDFFYKVLEKSKFIMNINKKVYEIAPFSTYSKTEFIPTIPFINDISECICKLCDSFKEKSSASKLKLFKLIIDELHTTELLNDDIDKLKFFSRCLVNKKLVLSMPLGTVNSNLISINDSKQASYKKDFVITFSNNKGITSNCFADSNNPADMQVLCAPVLILIDLMMRNNAEFSNAVLPTPDAATAIIGVVKRAYIDTECLFADLEEAKSNNLSNEISYCTDVTKCNQIYNILYVPSSEIKTKYKIKDFEELLVPAIAAYQTALDSMQNTKKVTVEFDESNTNIPSDSLEAVYLAHIIAAAFVTNTNGKYVKLDFYTHGTQKKLSNVMSFLEILNEKDTKNLSGVIEIVLDFLNNNKTVNQSDCYSHTNSILFTKPMLDSSIPSLTSKINTTKVLLLTALLGGGFKKSGGGFKKAIFKNDLSFSKKHLTTQITNIISDPDIKDKLTITKRTFNYDNTNLGLRMVKVGVGNIFCEIVENLPMQYNGDFSCNFSDKKLFNSIFKESFFQEDIQTIECLELSLIQAFIKKKKQYKNLLYLDYKSGLAMGPITHLGFIDSTGIYGNISKLKLDQKIIEEKVKQIENRVKITNKKINIICMLAPCFYKNSDQCYDDDMLKLFISPAIAAFQAAIDALPTKNVIKIETGNWGCNLAANAVEASYMAQFIAVWYLNSFYEGKKEIKLIAYPMESTTKLLASIKLMNKLSLAYSGKSFGEIISSAVALLENANVRVGNPSCF